MRHFLLFFIFCLVCFIMNPILAQERFILKSADDAYKNLNYGEAIPLYEKLVSKGQADTTALKKLSICYVKTKDTENAERILDLLVVRSPRDAQAMQMYARVLAGNGKYESSRQIFEKCRSLNPSDKIAEQFLRDYKNIHQLYKDSSLYSLSSVSVNTESSEFSPAFYKNSLVFVSSRHRDQTLKLVYELNNSSFLDLYTIDTTFLEKQLLNSSRVECSVKNISEKGIQNKKHIDDTRETSNDSHTAGNIHHSKDSSGRSDAGTKNVSPFLKRISSKYHEGPMSFSKNYDTVFLTRNYIPDANEPSANDRVNRIGIYYSIVSKNGKFETIYPADFTTNKHSVAHPALSKDGMQLFFASDMKGGSGGMDIYVTRKINGKWSKPENVTAVNTPGDEVFPYVDENDILYYSSDGSGGLGGLDIFSYNLSIFSDPVNMGFPINSCKDDFGILLYNNGRDGYFSSNRNTTGFNDNIFSFTSRNSGYRRINLRTVLFQLENHLVPLDSSEIVVLEKENKKKLGTLVVSGSEKEITLPANKSYQFLGSRPPYQTDVVEHFIRSSNSPVAERINVVFREKNFFEEKKPQTEHAPKVIRFKGKLLEKESGKPVTAMVAIFLGNEKNQFDLLYSDASGVFKESLIPGAKYFIKVADSRYGLLSDSVIADSETGDLEQTYYLIPNVAIHEGDSKRESWNSRASKTNLWGIVADAVSKEPLDAIVKVVYEGDTSNSFLTITDFDGTFSSSVSTPGFYSLSFLSEGYQLQSQRVDVREGDNEQHKFYLSKSKNEYDSISSNWLKKHSRGIVKGEILEEPGSLPLLDFVLLQQEGDSILSDYTSSDLDGKFEISIRKGINYTLVVKDKEHGDYSERIRLNGTDSILYRKITFNKDQKSVSLNLDSVMNEYQNQDSMYYQRYVAEVFDKANGRSIKALVGIQESRGGVPDEVSLSQPGKGFSFKLRKNVPYYVTVLSEGYQTKNIEINTNESNSLPSKIFLELLHEEKPGFVDSVVAEYRTNVSKHVTLSGKVFTEADKEPMISFVALYREGSSDPDGVHPSDENGYVSFSLNRNEVYKIEIREPGFLPIEEFINTSDTSVVYHREFILKEPLKKQVYDSLHTGWKNESEIAKHKIDSVAKSISIKPKNNALIVQGSVLDENTNESVKTRMILFVGKDNLPVQEIETDVNGKFVLSITKGKTYSVQLVADGYYIKRYTLSDENQYYIYYLKALPETLKPATGIADSSTYKKIVQDQLPVLFKGTVLEKETNAPITTVVALFLENDDNLVDMLYSDEAGSFQTSLIPERKYLLKIADARYLLLLDSVFPTSEFAEMKRGYFMMPNVSVRNNDATRETWNTKVAKVVLKGSVADAVSKEPVDAIVKVMSERDSSDSFLTITDFDGTFSSTLNSPGVYSLSFLSEGYQLQSKRIEIKEGDTDQQNFYLSKTQNDYDSISKVWLKEYVKGKLTGEILEEPGATPLLDFVLLQQEGDSVLSDYTSSDLDGKFEISVRKDVNYTLVVKDKEHGDYTERIFLKNSDSIIHRKVIFRKDQRGIQVNLDSVMSEYKQQDSSYYVHYKADVVDRINGRSLKALIGVQLKREGVPDEVNLNQPGTGFYFKLRKSQLYYITVLSEGYQTKTFEINTSDSSSLPSKIAMDLLRKEQDGFVDSVITQYRDHVKSRVTLTGEVIADKDEEPLITFVGLYKDGSTEPDGVHPSDENGMVSFPLHRNELYHVEIREPGYLPVSELVNTSDTAVIYRRIFRLKEPLKKEVYDSLQAGWKEMSVDKKTIVYGSILEAATFRPIPSKIAVYSKDKQGVLLESQTDEDGRFTLTVSPGEEYLVEASSYGYKVEANHLLIPAGSKLMNVYYHLKPLDKSTDPMFAALQSKNTEENLKKNQLVDKNETGKTVSKKVVSGIRSQTKTQLTTLVFDFNKSTGKSTDAVELKKLRQYLQKNNQTQLLITGYSDSVGREEYNEDLSYKRALSVKNYLVRNSIDSNRIRIDGKGELLPVASNETETGRKINRRVEYLLGENQDTTVLILNKTGMRFVYAPKEKRWISGNIEESWKEIQTMSVRNGSLVFLFNIQSVEKENVKVVEELINRFCVQYGIPESKVQVQLLLSPVAGSNIIVDVFYRIK